MMTRRRIEWNLEIPHRYRHIEDLFESVGIAAIPWSWCTNIRNKGNVSTVRDLHGLYCYQDAAKPPVTALTAL